MATITIPRRCSECRESIGTVSCEGCKDIFCTKHITEHRKELTSKFNRHMLEHKLVLNQLHSEERGNESAKKEILSRINQWEKNMIERIRCKAEMARERLDQLTGNDEKEINKQAQELTKKIYEKNGTEVLLEDDIEQLKQSIVHFKQVLNKLTRQSDVELYIEPSYMIDWNHLICVREKPVKTISSLISKTTIDKDSRDTKSSTTSNQRQKFTSYSNSESSSSSISSDDEGDSQEMDSSYNPNLFKRQLSNENISSSVQTKPVPLPTEKQVSSPPASVTLPDSLLSPNPERKTRRPLMVVDPISHKPVESVMLPSPVIDISRIPSEVNSTSETTTSSSATDKAQQQQEKMLRLLTDLLRGSPET